MLTPEDFKVGAVIGYELDGEIYTYKLIKHYVNSDSWEAIIQSPPRYEGVGANIGISFTVNNPKFFLAGQQEKQTNNQTCTCSNKAIYTFGCPSVKGNPCWNKQDSDLY